MTIMLLTIPVSLLLGAVGLAAFLWSLRSGQYRDLDGDAARILFRDDDLPPEARKPKAPDPEAAKPDDADGPKS